MKKVNIIDIMIVNATDWKWVEKEIQELYECGYDTLNKVYLHYADFFRHNKIPISKYKKFINNFHKTYNEEVA